MKNSSLFFLLGLLGLGACVDSEVCSTETTAILFFELLDKTNNEVQDTNLYEFGVGILSRDSTFFYDNSKPKKGFLFLNPFEDIASYFIYMKDLSFTYHYDTVPLRMALDSSYTIVDTITLASDTTVTYVNEIDTIPYIYIDTLSLYYERTNSYLNDACGFTFEFKLNDFDHTTNYIDSIKLNNKSILLDASENHMSIYIHTPKQ